MGAANRDSKKTQTRLGLTHHLVHAVRHGLHRLLLWVVLLLLLLLLHRLLLRLRLREPGLAHILLDGSTDETLGVL